MRCGVRRFGIAGSLFLILSLSVPRSSHAGWDNYGELHVGAGEAENTLLLDPNGPAQARGGRIDTTLRLLAGTRATWDRSTFEFSYSPYADFYGQNAPSPVSHSVASTWSHDFNPSASLRVSESYFNAPGQTLDPGGIRQSTLPVWGSSTAANDLKGTLAFRTSARTTLAWSFMDLRRVFADPRFVDSIDRGAGFELRERVSPHGTFQSGYEYGVFLFRDGLSLQTAGAGDPNIINPACDPAKDPNCFRNPGCGLLPLDPNCILGAFYPAPPAAGAQPAGGAGGAASSMGSVRHRPYVGYAYDPARGFQVDVQAGYDLLVFDDPSLQRATGPFIRSSLGWNGPRLSARIGYGQGLGEGGGILANARSRNGNADIRVALTRRLSLLLAATEELREGIVDAASQAGPGSLLVLVGTSSLEFEISRSWKLDATFIRYRQRSEGLPTGVEDVRSTRLMVGASWRFGRFKTPPRQANVLGFTGADASSGEEAPTLSL